MPTETLKTLSRTVNLEGLPDEVAQAFELMVNTLKQQVGARPVQKKKHVNFAAWSGSVHGKLTRTEIYDYVSTRVS